MQDGNKTKTQLLKELAELRRRVARLEAAEIERKRMEEALRESEERYKGLFEHMDSGVAVYRAVDDGADFIFIDFNRAGERIEQVDRRDIIDKRVTEAFPGVKDFGVFEVFQRVWRTGKTEYFPQAIYQDERDPGTWRESWVYKLPNDEIVAVYNDITARVRVEEELREREERFSLLAQNMPILVNAFGEDGNYVFWNRQAEKVTGYSAQEIIGNPNAFQLLYPDPRYLQQLMDEWAERGNAFANWEMVLTCKNGDQKIISWSNVSGLFPVPGWASWAVGVDVTDLIQVQQALKEHSEQLEEIVDERTLELEAAQEELIRKEKLAILGQLAGSVAHELRQPLGAIKNSAYYLNMVLQQPDPGVKEMLEIMNREIETSETIINSLLDLARARSPVRQKVNLNHIVQAAISRVAAPENIELVTQLEGALPLILADPGQLDQVFSNLILNAIQAMTLPSQAGTPEGGQLTIQSLITAPGWVAVSFGDTGPGIPPENLDKIFEPLFTTKARGIGLGLALAKSLVERHGGKVEVQSTPEEGSVFTVSLPLEL